MMDTQLHSLVLAAQGGDLEALLSGQYDDVPEKSFWMVGTIEQALAKR
jgi:F0F1-type ATP synthase beta subunit